MVDIKQKIALTLEFPDFLREAEDSAEVAYKILDLYYKGVGEDFLSDIQTIRLGRKLKRYYGELRSQSSPEIFLRTSLWIGETVTKWINISLSVENYESATNLRKLLYEEYE